MKVGVVGVGYLGRFHAHKYRDMEDVQLLGVVDINPEQAGKVARECGTTAFSDASDLIGKVDAVSIAVPTINHFDVAAGFLSAGVSVMLEKPITRTLEEAGQLIKLADDSNALLQIGHLERFNPAMLAARPHIGRPLFIKSSRLGPFSNRGIDVDVVLDLMIHDLDIIIDLVGEMPTSVQAVGVPVVTEHVDIANARLEFANGCAANITASRVSDESLRRTQLFQEDCYLSIDFGDHRVLTSLKKPNESSSPSEKRLTDIKVPPGDSLNEQLISFLKAVKTKSRPVVSGEDGRKALKLADEIMEKIKARAHLWPEEVRRGINE